MAVKISQMTSKTGGLTGNELIEIADGTNTRRITALQLANMIRTITTRTIDLTLTGDDPNNRKIIESDNHNVVRLGGNCGYPSIYFHDDVLAIDNFRVTVVVPENADNSGSGDGYSFYVIYYDGSSSETIWRLPSKEDQQTRDIAYEITISQGEIIVIGQTDSDFTQV